LNTLSNLAPDALLPIPLAEGRAYVRGYNQAELIAQAISRRTDIPVEKNILYRIKTRRPQSKVKRENREANVAGLFAADGEMLSHKKPERVVLVDDIVTTGATCRETTRVLELAGVTVVGWVSIAHG
jgi:ComF family protein